LFSPRTIGPAGQAERRQPRTRRNRHPWCDLPIPGGVTGKRERRNSGSTLGRALPRQSPRCACNSRAPGLGLVDTFSRPIAISPHCRPLIHTPGLQVAAPIQATNCLVTSTDLAPQEPPCVFRGPGFISMGFHPPELIHGSNGLSPRSSSSVPMPWTVCRRSEP